MLAQKLAKCGLLNLSLRGCVPVRQGPCPPKPSLRPSGSAAFLCRCQASVHFEGCWPHAISHSKSGPRVSYLVSCIVPVCVYTMESAFRTAEPRSPAPCTRVILSIAIGLCAHGVSSVFLGVKGSKKRSACAGSAFCSMPQSGLEAAGDSRAPNLAKPANVHTKRRERDQGESQSAAHPSRTPRAAAALAEQARRRRQPAPPASWRRRCTASVRSSRRAAPISGPRHVHAPRSPGS